MADIRFHPEAQEEYQQALMWYQERSPHAANRFEMETDRLLAMIAASPGMFPLYDPKHRFAMFRRFPYSVVYQAEPTEIYVIAMAHSRRLPGYWLRRK